MSDFTDLYALLGVEGDATAEALRKAYRKESLKCHPDKNPDDQDAVNRFYALKEAFDLLSAPEKRAAYDAKRSSVLKQRERFASLHGKRKADLADLHAREEAFQRQRTAHSESKADLERIKEQNARLMRERIAQQMSTVPPAQSEATFQPSKPAHHGKIGEHDTKVSLKWGASIDRPALNDATTLEAALQRMCGDIASCAVLPKRKAIVEFSRLSSAVKAVDLSGKTGTVLEGVTVSWLMGEPEVVRAARARGTAAPAATVASPRSAAPPDKAPGSLDEDAVLSKLREQQRHKAEERARLEAEILAQDAAEEREAAGRR